MQFLGSFLKRQNDLCLFLSQTIEYHRNPSLCSNQLCWRSWSWKILRRPIRPSRTNTQRRCPFHCRGLEGKSRKSRDSWSNRQTWFWNTKWSRAKANGALPREHISHRKHPFPTTQEKTLHVDITRWPISKSDWLYSLQPKIEKFCKICKNKTRSWLWLGSWTPCCQIQAIGKFPEKVGKITRPLRYDLNQIAYNYTVEATNRLKGLDLIDRVLEELWAEVHDILYRRQWSRASQEKEMQKAKWFLRRPYK